MTAHGQGSEGRLCAALQPSIHINSKLNIKPSAVMSFDGGPGAKAAINCGSAQLPTSHSTSLSSAAARPLRSRPATRYPQRCSAQPAIARHKAAIVRALVPPMVRKPLTIPLLVLVLAVWAQTVWPALAWAAGPAEQIVLPFDCRLTGGRVEASPSSDQAYRIFGPREQKVFRACSRQNPDRCRSFMLHRFTMACGGARVTWPEFYAAISAHTGRRAVLDEGQIRYRVGERWRARENYGFDDPFEDRPGGPGAGGGTVTMPRGFAPLTGTNAIFTPLDPRVAELEEAEGRKDLDPDAPPVADLKPPAPVPAKRPPEERVMADAKPADPAPPAAEIKSAPPPAPATVTAPAPQPAPAPEPAPAVAPSAAVSATTPPPPMAPTILNNPAAAKLRDAASPEKESATTVVAASEVPLPAASPGSNPSPPATSVKGWEGSGGSRALSMPPLYIAMAIAAATLLALLAILKQQAAQAMGQAAPVAGPRPHGPDEPVLPGFDPPAASPGQALALREPAAPPSATGRAGQATGMPATRAEALDLLGLSADAPEAAIRKVVEALRQSWHPDLATTKEDRAAREERLKRINVAADLLSRRTAV